MTKLVLTACIAGLFASPGLAQTSSNFKLEEHVFNQGGNPDSDGQILSSTGFRMTVDSIGEGLSGAALGSTSFNMDPGFLPAYRPPGEVRGLRFDDNITLLWNADPSSGSYNLYRDSMASAYGTCEQTDIGLTKTTDPGTPVSGQTFFYLVTVSNRLDEEGTKGFATGPAERAGSVCP